METKETMGNGPNPRRWSLQGEIPRHTLTLLRVWIGMTWLRAGLIKLTTEGGWGANLLSSIERSAPNPLFEPFLSNVVVTNAGIFAGLVSWGEFLVGISLTLGIASRFGAGIGMFLSINYMLLQNRFFPGYDGTLLIAQLVLLYGASGRAFGMDGYLHRRWPSFPIW